VRSVSGLSDWYVSSRLIIHPGMRQGTIVKHGLARHLRKNPTEAEERLWWKLRYRQLLGCKFRRQAPIGEYVVDFVCHERKLIVELDGGGHTRIRREDAVRTAWLESQGFVVLRFWNFEVIEDLDCVVEGIWNSLSRAAPPPRPSPTRGEGDS
jgi:very-short-patch-repair endonuclease